MNILWPWYDHRQTFQRRFPCSSKRTNKTSSENVVEPTWNTPKAKRFLFKSPLKAILTIDNWIIFASLHYSTVIANSRDASTHPAVRTVRRHTVFSGSKDLFIKI